MTNPAFDSRPRSRRGFGLFVVAVGVVVVLAAIVGVNQIGSLTQATRDTTQALELTHKTTLVAESAIDEGCYGALALDLNNPDGPSDGLYMKLRSLVPPADGKSANAGEQPVFEGALPYVMSGKYEPKLTYDAMNADPELKLNSFEPVVYGPTDAKAIISNQASGPLVLNKESNESAGIMGFAHTVSSKGVGWFKEVDQSVQFFRPYKCVVMGTPWPYSKYTLYVRELYGDPNQNPTGTFFQQFALTDPLQAFAPTGGMFAKRGPVPCALAQYLRKVYWHDTIVKLYTDAYKIAGKTPTPITTAGINFAFDQLNRPWVYEGDANGSAITGLQATDAEIAALKTIEPLPAGTGLDDVGMRDWFQLKLTDPSKEAELADVITKLNAYGEKLKAIGAKIPLRPVPAPEYEKWYKAPSSTEPPPAFASISPQGWLARATRVYKGVDDLKLVMDKDKSAFELNGVYYFQGPGPYVIDKPYKGKGILIFEDNVTVSNFAPSDTDSHAVLVAVPAPPKKDAISITVAGDVTADLIAPYGTVYGAAGANPTATIRGAVTVQFLADAATPSNNFFDGTSSSPMFPTIDRGSKNDWEFQPPAASGGAYDKKFAKHMQVFFDPGYVKKLYWSKRDRKS